MVDCGMNRKLFRKSDLFIIGSILLIAILIIYIPKLSAKTELRLQIIRDSEVLYDIAFSDIVEPTEYLAGSLVIKVSPDGAKVTSADCPDKICMQSGLLCKNGDTAVCVPEKVIVRVTANKTDRIDAVVY